MLHLFLGGAPVHHRSDNRVFQQPVSGAENGTLPRRGVLCQTNFGHLRKENATEHWGWARESRAGIF